MVVKKSRMRTNQNNLISVETGSANLEFMKYAVNYNNHLTNLLTRNLTTNSSILDFGAGTGEFALRLVEKGFEVSVLEVEQKLADNLKRIGFPTSTAITEIPDSSFSFVYSLNVLEHIENDTEALKLISSKLTSDGKIILYLPAFNILFSEMDKRVGHYRRYSKKSIRRALIDGGFEVELMRYSDFLGFCATLLYKVTPNRNGSVSIRTIRFFDSYIYPMNKIFDRVFGNLCGKNIFIVARKEWN